MAANPVSRTRSQYSPAGMSASVNVASGVSPSGLGVASKAVSSGADARESVTTAPSKASAVYGAASATRPRTVPFACCASGVAGS